MYVLYYYFVYTIEKKRRKYRKHGESGKHGQSTPVKMTDDNGNESLLTTTITIVARAASITSKHRLQVRLTLKWRAFRWRVVRSARLSVTSLPATTLRARAAKTRRGQPSVSGSAM